MDGPGLCCAQMDDFDRVASPCVRELGLAEWEMDLGAPDVDQKVSEVPVALPALVDVEVEAPVVWPVKTKMEPQAHCVSIEVLPDRGSDVISEVYRDFSCERNDTGVIQNIHWQTESCPSSVGDLASVPMSLAVESNTEVQVDVRWELVSAVVPSGDVLGAAGEARLRTDVSPMLLKDLTMEPMSFPVVTDVVTQVEVGWEPTLMVHPSGIESGRPVGWLDTGADNWMVEEMMLDLGDVSDRF